jgi:phasin family protein
MECIVFAQQQSNRSSPLKQILDIVYVALHHSFHIAPQHSWCTLMNLTRSHTMNANFDQVVAAQNAFLKTFADVSTQALNGVQKLAELNLQTVKATMAESVEQYQSMLAVKDPSKLAEIGAAAAQPAGEKAAAYAKHVYDITSTVGNGIATSVQAHIADSQSLATEWVEAAAKAAPAGSEPAVNAAKQALAMFQGAYDKAVVATNQAVAKATEMAEQAAPAKAKAAKR